MRWRIIDQNHAARAMVFRLHHFVDKGRVRSKPLAAKHALFVVFLQLVAQNQNQLVMASMPA